MNPDQQRIAIAEACGWRIKRRDITGFNVWEPDAKLPAQLCNNLENKIPDYLNDLNAMATAESIIIKAGAQTIRLYEDALQKFVANIIFATATQRAEAFLRTLNLWKP